MMEIMRSSLRGDLATTSDVHAMEQRMDARLAASAADLHAMEQRMDARLAATAADLHTLEQRMTKTFVTWMLASQAAFTTIVAVFFTLST